MKKNNKFTSTERKKQIKTESWIKYEDSIVIFLDILGFKSLIDASYSEKNKKTNNKVIANLYDGIQTIRSILKIDEPENHGSKYFIVNFSDSIVISFPYNKPDALFNTLFQIQGLLINLTHRGIIVRGGITRGPIYTDKESQIIFGPGLVDAYLLESKAAHYPRVILDREIVEICKRFTKDYDEDEIEDYLKDILMPDTDEMFFIDYFKPLDGQFYNINYDYSKQLSETRIIISNGLKKRSPDVKIKYLWMKKKYNGILKKIQSQNYLNSLKELDKQDLADGIKNLKPIS